MGLTFTRLLVDRTTTSAREQAGRLALCAGSSSSDELLVWRFTDMTTLAELAQAVSISSTRTDTPAAGDQDFSGAHYWVALSYQGRQMTVDYFHPSDYISEPTSEQVLEHLLGDADTYLQSSDFEDWAGEFGYDKRSFKAYRTYLAVGTQTKMLQYLLGDDFDQFITADEA